MIKINLLGEEGAPDNSAQKAIAVYVLSILLLIGICYVIRSSFTSDIQRLTLEIEDKNRELEELKKKTQEVKDLEAKEAEYNNKIAVIANLKKSKIGPVRVLDDLNIAIPERAWLMRLREESGVLSIDGRALDSVTVSDFIGMLGKSHFLTPTSQVETKQVEDRGINIYQFRLEAKVDYTGGAGTAEGGTNKQG